MYLLMVLHLINVRRKSKNLLQSIVQKYYSECRRPRKIIIFIGNQYGWEYIQPIEEILGAFPLSHTWDGAEI